MLLHRRLWEDIRPAHQRGVHYAAMPESQQRPAPHVSHAAHPASHIQSVSPWETESRALEMPALRVRDEEIAKHLDARDGFQFFRIDEVGVERERLAFAEQLH